MLCPLVLLVLLALHAAPAAAADVDAARLDRLAVLGRLWGYGAYLHPALHDAKAAALWDRAFVDAVPVVLETGAEDGLNRAAEQLLASLGDPATRVVTKPVPRSAPTPRDPTWRDERGVLVVDLRDPATTPDWNDAGPRWRALADAVAGARAVVFDLRSAPDTTFESRFALANAFVDSGVGLALACHGLTAPAVRSRGYDGFAPERGGTSGGYQRLFQLTSPAPLATFRTPPPPANDGHPFTVFVVDRESIVPDCAAALALAGKGAIVAEGGTGVLESVPLMEWPLGGPHIARLRLGDAVRPDGSPWPGVDQLVTEHALETAVALARAGKKLARLTSGGELPRPTPSAPRYPEGDLPAPGWRVLAVAKTCILIELFFPYRDLMTEDWEVACRVALQEVLAADDADAYRVAMARLLRATGDSHVGLRGPAQPAVIGGGAPPFRMRFVEGRPVVTELLARAPANLSVGDEIITVEGRPVDERAELLRGLIASSTPQRRDEVVARTLLSGAEGAPVRFQVAGPGGQREIVAERVPLTELNVPSVTASPPYRLLEPDIGFADLTRLVPSDVLAMFDAFAGAKWIVFDLRGYPNGTAWSIAPRLSEAQQTPAALFERRDVRAADFTSSHPESVRRTKTFVQRLPERTAAPWRGRSILLIDERAVSQSEHTGLFLRAANGTRFIGSPTAGANGDVTSFELPGGLQVRFTGQSVRWPDGTLLQRRGLQPDVEAKPTIAGIRAGRDEVLEAALAWLRSQEK